MAQVHPIITRQGQAGPPADPHPLVLDLRRSTSAVLGELLLRMLDHADDWLFESAEHASDAERRHYFDTMRLLRLGRTAVLRDFTARIERGFTPVAQGHRPVLVVDADELMIQPTEELEIHIAVTNMASRAEVLFPDLIREVEQRMRKAAEQHYVPVVPDALTPARICAAFGVSLEPLKTDFQTKLVVFKLFERGVLSGLDKVYHKAQEALDHYGIGEPQSRSAVPTSGNQAKAQANLSQRLLHANHLMTGLPDEVDLAPSEREVIAQFREILLRAAWFEPVLRSRPEHPMHGELRRAAAIADRLGRASGGDDSDLYDRLRDVLKCTRTLLGELLNTEAPGRSAGADLAAYSEFLRSESRRQASVRIEQVRRIVQKEVAGLVSGYILPTSVTNLLRFGIAPLLVNRRLRQGPNSERYRAGLTLIQRLLNSLVFIPPPGEAVLAERRSLLQELAAGLQEAGRDSGKVELMLKQLVESYQQFDQPWPTDEAAEVSGEIARPVAGTSNGVPQPSPAPISRQEALGLLGPILRPGNWFRVYDAKFGRTRWMRLTACYPDQDSIVFDGFDDRDQLGLTLRAFAIDVSAGRSDAISPDDAAQAALDQLRQARPE